MALVPIRPISASSAAKYHYILIPIRSKISLCRQSLLLPNIAAPSVSLAEKIAAHHHSNLKQSDASSNIRRLMLQIVKG